MTRMKDRRRHEMQVMRETYILLTSVILAFVAIMMVLRDGSSIVQTFRWLSDLALLPTAG